MTLQSRTTSAIITAPPCATGASPLRSQPFPAPTRVIYYEETPPAISPGYSVRDFLVSDTQRWYIAHTKSRAEKEFARKFLAQGIGYFLPMERKPDRYGRQAARPAFPGYCFFIGDDDVIYAAHATNKICQVIPVLNQTRLINEMAALEAAADETGLIVRADDFEVGIPCRVKPGHWAHGYEGFIERFGNRGIIELRITALNGDKLIEGGLIGGSVPIEIAREFLEVIEDDPQ